MEKNQLRDQLNDLHKELETATRRDRQAEDLLTNVMTDIGRVAAGEQLEPDEGENLRQRLEKKASDFEVRHPKLAGVMRDVSDILAKLGF